MRGFREKMADSERRSISRRKNFTIVREPHYMYYSHFPMATRALFKQTSPLLSKISTLISDPLQPRRVYFAVNLSQGIIIYAKLLYTRIYTVENMHSTEPLHYPPPHHCVYISPLYLSVKLVPRESGCIMKRDLLFTKFYCGYMYFPPKIH